MHGVPCPMTLALLLHLLGHAMGDGKATMLH